mmetsp:Transcript_71704/g.118751  ORF Transcript_71704/g.118751 Transcript_71704/m.118751 type:complete len:495 (-) Transcript_71704:238-1722(-)
MGCGGSKPAEGAGGKKNDVGGKSIQKDNVKAGGLSHAGFIIDNPGKIQDFYDIDKKKLGEGSYGAVSKCTNKSTGVTRAVKSISKAQMKNLDRFKQEIQIMKIMDHPNIIKLFESFEDHRNIYLVLELCTGGELFDRIIDAGHFTEVQAAIVMQHMFRAIFYMHENHICHRDLKPENFLFSTKDPIEKCALKVIDFGLACKFSADQVLTTKAGTPYYVAPQVLAGKYDQSSDLWSLGVIMYVVLCGYPPFYGETDADVLAKVRLGNFSFNAADWKSISEDAKNLIRMLLKMNPRERFTADQALNHAWIKEHAPRAEVASLGSEFFDNLRKFKSMNKMQKAALHIIAGKLTDDRIKALRDTFMALDTNQDGMLTTSEIKDGLHDNGIFDIPQDLQQLLMDVDSDGSGVIDYTEFLAATMKKEYLTEETCWQAFATFDRDGDGVISNDEVNEVLNSGSLAGDPTESGIERMLLEADSNGDGVIDFEEFRKMMVMDE